MIKIINFFLEVKMLNYDVGAMITFTENGLNRKPEYFDLDVTNKFKAVKEAGLLYLSKIGKKAVTKSDSTLNISEKDLLMKDINTFAYNFHKELSNTPHSDISRYYGTQKPYDVISSAKKAFAFIIKCHELLVLFGDESEIKSSESKLEPLYERVVNYQKSKKQTLSNTTLNSEEKRVLKEKWYKLHQILKAAITGKSYEHGFKVSDFICDILLPKKARKPKTTTVKNGDAGVMLIEKAD